MSDSDANERTWETPLEGKPDHPTSSDWSDRQAKLFDEYQVNQLHLQTRERWAEIFGAKGGKREFDCDSCLHFDGLTCTHNPKLSRYPCSGWMRAADAGDLPSGAEPRA